ncbi:MAG: DUF3795 domain-containing protein, partial [Candidatus Helarchaeota archaeon]
ACNGCLSENQYIFCKSCAIRVCVHEKGLSGCHQCAKFPCDKIDKFPFELAKQFMLKSTPFRREHIDAEWVAWEEQNWTCEKCGTHLFRGAKRCPECNEKIISILE